jgi:hypothetical protein
LHLIYTNSNLIIYKMNTAPLYPVSQHQTAKRRETLRTREETQTAEQSSTVLYNLRDFLPQSSAIIA